MALVTQQALPTCCSPLGTCRPLALVSSVATDLNVPCPRSLPPENSFAEGRALSSPPPQALASTG